MRSTPLAGSKISLFHCTEPPPSIMTEQCAFCGDPATDRPLQKCSGCRQRKYCDQACQRAAWRAGHKEECRRLRSSSSSPSSSASAATSMSASPGGAGGGGGGGAPPPSSTPSHAASSASIDSSAAATSPDPSSSRETKKNKKKKSKSKTDTTNGPAASPEPNTTHAPTDRDTPSESKNVKKTDVKTMWVTIFKCFHCGKHGHDLTKCLQCEEAYYCDRKCQEAHATVHAKVCIATVTAKAQRAHRERLARVVRENGQDNVEGGEEDDLCVICQSRPVNAVQVS